MYHSSAVAALSYRSNMLRKHLSVWRYKVEKSYYLSWIWAFKLSVIYSKKFYDNQIILQCLQHTKQWPPPVWDFWVTEMYLVWERIYMFIFNYIDSISLVINIKASRGSGRGGGVQQRLEGSPLWLVWATELMSLHVLGWCQMYFFFLSGLGFPFILILFLRLWLVSTWHEDSFIDQTEPQFRHYMGVLYSRPSRCRFGNPLWVGSLRQATQSI